MTIRLNSSTSGYTELDAPAVGGNNTLRLPGDNGTSGYLMQTDGSGNLSWRDPSSLLSPYRNRIINGDMRIWQRGTSFTGVGSVYCADRFALVQASGVTGTITQDASVPNAQFKYSLKLVPALNGTPAEFAIRQILEQQNVYDFAGQSVTASAWVRCSKPEVKVRLGSFNATGGTDISQTINVTANTWTKISYTFTSYTGVTAWTSTPNDWGGFLDIGFVNSTALTTSDSLFITGVQLEAGSVATPFERRNYAQELSLCQRYFQLAGNGCFGSVDGSSTSVIAFAERFFVPMRTAPTVVWKTGGTANWRYAGGDISNGGTSSLANTISTVNAVWSQQGGFSGLTANLPVFSRNQTSTGEFLACSAEL
jgi:hypothetical protein